MPYSNNPGTVPRDKVYIELGLTDPTQSLLTDEEVDYYLERASDSILLASVAAARMILFKLSQYTRFSNDSMEVWGGEQAKNWMQALEMFIAANDPESPKRSTAIAVSKATGYAGNVSNLDINTNNNNPDNNFIEKVKNKNLTGIPIITPASGTDKADNSYSPTGYIDFFF
jgi:hypothetical protein